MTKKKIKLTDFAGTLTDEEAKNLKKRISNSRKFY